MFYASQLATMVTEDNNTRPKALPQGTLRNHQFTFISIHLFCSWVDYLFTPESTSTSIPANNTFSNPAEEK
jgi:hypothetical protein